MVCMKCGSKMESEQAFCQDCLLEMEKYPVKPGTAVHLPIRKDVPLVRKSNSRRRTVSPEEQVIRLKKRIWFLSGALVVTLSLVISMAYPAANYFIRKYHLRPGQNYNTIIPSTASAEPTETTEVLETTLATEDPWIGYAD